MGFKVITGEAAVTQGEGLPVSFTAEKSWPRRLRQALNEGGWGASGVRTPRADGRALSLQLSFGCHLFLSIKLLSFKPKLLITHGKADQACGQSGVRSGSMHTCARFTLTCAHVCTSVHTPWLRPGSPFCPVGIEWRFCLARMAPSPRQHTGAPHKLTPPVPVLSQGPPPRAALPGGGSERPWVASTENKHVFAKHLPLCPSVSLALGSTWGPQHSPWGSRDPHRAGGDGRAGRGTGSGDPQEGLQKARSGRLLGRGGPELAPELDRKPVTCSVSRWAARGA